MEGNGVVVAPIIQRYEALIARCRDCAMSSFVIVSAAAGFATNRHQDETSGHRRRP